MSSATDELRKLLDERGIEYSVHEDSWAKETYWIVSHKPYRFSERSEYGTCVLHNITPEQAIAATLGRGTCEYAIKDNMNETEGMGDVWIECSACHCVFDYYADKWLMNMHYCPNCGAKVVSE